MKLNKGYGGVRVIDEKTRHTIDEYIKQNILDPPEKDAYDKLVCLIIREAIAFALNNKEFTKHIGEWCEVN